MKKRQVVVQRSDLGRRSNFSNSTMHIAQVVRYGECLKNHAASTGGYALDGCREFMATGDEGTNQALLCAACGCHRNFHMKQEEASCESSSPT